MFAVREDADQSGRRIYVIRDENKEYLHSDGTTYFQCSENWPSKRRAQAVLDKFYPKPKNPEPKNSYNIITLISRRNHAST